MNDFTKILDKAKELESKMKESQEKIKKKHMNRKFERKEEKEKNLSTIK